MSARWIRAKWTRHLQAHWVLWRLPRWPGPYWPPPSSCLWPYLAALSEYCSLCHYSVVQDSLISLALQSGSYGWSLEVPYRTASIAKHCKNQLPIHPREAMTLIREELQLPNQPREALQLLYQPSGAAATFNSALGRRCNFKFRSRGAL